MHLGRNWIIFFMYSASPYFNSFFAAKPLDLFNINEKCSMKIAPAPSSFILFIHSRAVTRVGITCWIWASEQPWGSWGQLFHCALSFPSQWKGAGEAARAALWAAPVCAVCAGGSQLCCWAASGCVSRARSAQPSILSWQGLFVPRAPDTHSWSVSQSSRWRLPKGSTINHRSKNKAKNVFIAEKTWKCLWCFLMWWHPSTNPCHFFVLFQPI